MGRYNFVSPGAEGGNALQQFLMQRELLQRKQQEELYTRQHQEAQLALQRQQEQRVAEAQQQAQADAERQRSFQRASTIASTALPGDVVDEATAGQLREAGFGSQVQQPQPGILQMRGGSQFMNAEAQRTSAAANADANRASAEERAREANATREEIARVAATGQSDSRAIRDQLAVERNAREQAAADQKTEAANKVKTDAARAVKADRSKVRELAQGLLNDPELGGITGTIEGRRNSFLTGGAMDALSRYNQLVNSLTVSERGKLKGQGTISDYEGKMLGSSVSALNRAAGPENVKKHLQDIVNLFNGDTPADAVAGSPDDGWTTLPNGIRIREKR